MFPAPQQTLHVNERVHGGPMHLRYLLYETPAWRDCDVKINSHLFLHESHCVQGPLLAFIVAVQSLKVSLQSFLYIHSSILFHGLQTDGRGIEVKCLHMQRASFQHQNVTGRNIYIRICLPSIYVCVCVCCVVVLKSGGIQMAYSVSKRCAWKR